jgi:hypothetical protein
VIAPTTRPVLSRAELDAYDPRPSGKGAERRYCCPLEACREKPVDRGHQSLCVNVESGLWLCYRCQAKGRLTDHWAEGPAPSRGAPRRAAPRRPFVLVPPPPEPGRAASAPQLAPMLAACVPVGDSPGARYLARRGADAPFATAAGVRFSRDWYGRAAVVFPLADWTGRVVAANGRYIDRGSPKTRSVGDRSLGVFATPGALSGPMLVIAEGPMDALALAECGLPAVALVATTAPWWLKTMALNRRVVVALDADVAGDRGADGLLAHLARFARSVERLRPPVVRTGDKDWNEALLALGYGGLCEWLEGVGLLSAPVSTGW